VSVHRRAFALCVAGPFIALLLARGSDARPSAPNLVGTEQTGRGSEPRRDAGPSEFGCVPDHGSLSGRPARLIAAYVFEEGTGTATPAAPGTRPLRPGTSSAEWFGNGLVLDGVQDHVRIERPGWPTGDYTYAVWVLPRAVDHWQAILEIQTPASRGLELALAAGGRIEVWSSGKRRIVSGRPLAPGRWTHVALARRGALMTLLVDGVAQRASRDHTVFDFGQCPALIGVDADQGCAGRLNGFFAGAIDDLRVYDCALPATAIHAVKSAPTAPAPARHEGTAPATDEARTVPPGLLGTPTWLDMGVAEYLAVSLNWSRSLRLWVAEGVSYGVLGGVWYAAALFMFWVRSDEPGHADLRPRVLTIAFGSIAAALLTLIEARLVSWPPPSAHPDLAGLFPDDLPDNLNTNCFPSQSTALYASLSAGIYSLSRTTGRWAWLGVGVLVALPRMFLGGHYMTDVIAGLVAGLGGYLIATRLLEANVARRCARLHDDRWGWRRIVLEGAVFLWILQVALEFGHAAWVANAMETLWR